MVTATGFCRARRPARARTKMIGRYRPASMTTASATLQNVVFPDRPPEALPLLLAELVNA